MKFRDAYKTKSDRLSKLKKDLDKINKETEVIKTKAELDNKYWGLYAKAKGNLKKISDIQAQYKKDKKILKSKGRV